MKNQPLCVAGLCLVLAAGISVAEQAADPATLRKEIQELKQSFEDMRRAYEARIRALEQKLDAIQKPAADKPADDLAALRREAEAAARETQDAANRSAEGTSTSSLSAFNPRITVFADLLARADDRTVRNEDGDIIGDRIALRETEIDFRADVDPFAKGMLILALEEETPNQFDITIEEGYATFETLPFNLHAKAGRFRTGFGQINKLHLHDLPQVNYPLPVRTFLGEEGDVQNGLAVSYLAPEFSGFVPELDFQLLNGENEPVLAGGDSNSPAYLGHLKLFRDVGENQFIELGVSHLYGFNDANNDQATHLSGLDFLYKWKPLESGESRSFVLQSELFYLDREQSGADIHSLGAYGYGQYQLAKRWYAGIRGDWSEFPDSAD
ncbi:MAG: hypothetical protein QF886_01105, partial [Planctomycetota bacterium]|nr:hypothetical protein [Planctomycetota bacterium]